jgi:hypothetical protein
VPRAGAHRAEHRDRPYPHVPVIVVDDPLDQNTVRVAAKGPTLPTVTHLPPAAMAPSADPPATDNAPLLPRRVKLQLADVRTVIRSIGWDMARVSGGTRRLGGPKWT